MKDTEFRMSFILPDKNLLVNAHEDFFKRAKNNWGAHSTINIEGIIRPSYLDVRKKTTYTACE